MQYYKQTQLETMASDKAAAEFQLEKELKRIQEVYLAVSASFPSLCKLSNTFVSHAKASYFPVQLLHSSSPLPGLISCKSSLDDDQEQIAEADTEVDLEFDESDGEDYEFDVDEFEQEAKVAVREYSSSLSRELIIDDEADTRKESRKQRRKKLTLKEIRLLSMLEEYSILKQDKQEQKRISAESNPQMFGANWAVQLEKVTLHASEEW